VRLPCSNNGEKLVIHYDDLDKFLKKENFKLAQVQVKNEPEVELRNGNRRVLAIRVNTQDHTCNSSKEEIKQFLFDPDVKSKSVCSYYALQSHDAVRFAGEVIELDIDLPTVSLSKLVAHCYPIAQDLGYNFNHYDHVIFFTDNTRNYLGVGYLNGKFCHIDKSNSLKVMTHEIGHNLGFHHSSKIHNGSVVEYGDLSCSMGGRHRELNAFKILDKGWIGSNNVYKVERPSKSLNLHALEYDLSHSDKNQILYLESPDHSYTLTVSMRTNFNTFDQDLSSDYTNKLSIHQNYLNSKSLLLDILDIGESYYSEQLRRTIRFEGFAQDKSALVDIY